MHADKFRRRRTHGVFIERPRIVQHVAPNHRRKHAPSINAIAVDLSASRKARAEIGTNLFGSHDANRWWQHAIQRMLKFAGRHFRLRLEAGHLAERVNSGIGSAGARQLYIFLRKFAKDADDFALNRGLARLKLPAVKIGAVVSNRELEIAHAWESFYKALTFGD